VCRGGRGLVCRDGYLFKRLRPSLAGFLLVGVAGLPLGIGILLHGFTLLGVAVLLPAVVVMLLGAGVLIRWRLARVSLALLGVAALPAGIVALLDGQTLVGAAILFGGISLRLLVSCCSADQSGEGSSSGWLSPACLSRLQSCFSALHSSITDLRWVGWLACW
jgi:hypothetical protein